MATLYVDNQPYTFNPGKSLLDVCLSLGFNVPYFCWHPALHSVGACRQCAIKLFKDENDSKGKIVMSCMTAAKDGMRISVDDAEVIDFRARVIEWLMVNHPHDCPVCDEGGECHLQDMTVMTGHAYRRYRFPKRTYNNQDLGPFVNHEMNRCIQCYRCVRFYRDYAGGKDLAVLGWHDHVYFGRHEEGKLQSEFSGNLVEVCPTGVFTDKTLKQHYTRKWDLQTAPSVCVHCGLGCNTIPGERYGSLRRVHARYNEDVNRYWLCDRGRYGYEFVNSPRRIREPMLRRGLHPTDKKLIPSTRAETMGLLAKTLAEGKVIGIGSPRASLEANLALRSLVGQENFFHGLSQKQWQLTQMLLETYRAAPEGPASLHEVEQCDSVLVLGEDVTNSAPLLALALRQAAIQAPAAEAAGRGINVWEDFALRDAIQDEKGPFFIAHPYETKLDELATAVSRSVGDAIARMGFAIAHEIDPAAPAVEGLSEADAEFVRQAAAGLKAGRRPLVVAGTSGGSEAILRAAGQIIAALKCTGKSGKLSLVVPECNSLGLAMLGGESLDSALKAVQGGPVQTLIVLENDLYQRADAALVDALLSGVRQVVALDCVSTRTTENAHFVLPCSSFAECDGTLVSNEGRAQRFFQVFVPHGEIRESWRWLGDLAVLARQQEGLPWPKEPWRNLDMLLADLAEAIPELRGAANAAPPETFRAVEQKIPRQPHRYSGRAAITANVDVNEPRPPEDVDAPMNYSMEGFDGQPPPALIPRFWSPGWNSAQAINKFQIEVEGSLRGGPVGVRLIAPAAVQGGSAEYCRNIPPAIAPREGQFLALGAPQIFGSDPLSMLSPAIAGCAPEPFLAISSQQAALLHLKEGQMVALRAGSVTVKLPLRLWPELPAAVVAVPAGLPEIPALDWPQWATLEPLAATEEERP